MIGNSLPILGKTSYDRRAKLDALNKSQAIVEFDVSGKVLWANENFLTLLGYTLPEIKGKHHSLFVAPKLHNSPEYKAFEDNLRRGLFQSGEFHRIGKGARTYGSRRPTILCSTVAANLTRLSSLRLMSPLRRLNTRNFADRSKPSTSLKPSSLSVWTE